MHYTPTHHDKKAASLAKRKEKNMQKNIPKNNDTTYLKYRHQRIISFPKIQLKADKSASNLLRKSSTSFLSLGDRFYSTSTCSKTKS